MAEVSLRRMIPVGFSTLHQRGDRASRSLHARSGDLHREVIAVSIHHHARHTIRFTKQQAIVGLACKTLTQRQCDL